MRQIKKQRAIAWGTVAVLATAIAAAAISDSTSRSANPFDRALAEAKRALVKERAESARKRIEARLQKRAERQAKIRTRTSGSPIMLAYAEATAPTPTRQEAIPANRHTPSRAVGQVRRTIALASSARTVVHTRSTDHGATLIKPTQTGIPKGFEDWFAPQKTAVDLYYGGRFLTTALVEYTMNSITFLEPQEVATHIPGLRSTSELGSLLASPQDTHSEKVCAHQNQPLCGRLEPATIGVIFDETRFRADLFVNPSLLLMPQQASGQYLPEPAHNHPTLVQNLGSLYSGSSEGVDRFSLFGRTRVGHGRGHGFANWVSTDDNSLSVDELGYTHDFKDIQVSAGLFEPAIDTLRAVPRQPILGVSVARSLLTRTDLESMIASPIELFMPVRGRVDIFRDRRLISTGFYEAGNQRIDTTNLPGGAYNIDIVITDVTGSTRTLQQLFTKSSLMAPPGEPLWFVDAGQVMQRNPQASFPDDYGTTQLRAGYRWRQKPWLGFGSAAALTENESMIELSSGLLFDWLEAGGEIYGSSAGGSGFGLRGLMHWKELVASANIQQTTADDPPSLAGEYRLLSSKQSLSSLSVSHPLWQGLATANFSQRDSQTGSTSQRTTVGYTRTFPLGGYHSLQVQTEVGDEDGNALAMLTLQWRNTRGQWSDSAQIRLTQNDTAGNVDKFSAGAATTWHDGERFMDDVEIGLRAEAGDQNKSVTLDAQHRSQYGHGSASLTTSDSNGLGQTLVSLGYDTSLVIGEGGKTAFGGGPNLNEAGVLLDLQSAPGARLEVIADGQPQFIARGGSKAALTLPPYHQYRIRLKDSGLALTQFDDQPREVTLYPGHVVNMDWTIQPIQVLIGRIVKADGQTLGNARIEGAEGPAYTDEDGFIQTEVRGGTRELVARVDGRECRILLPVTDNKASVLRLTKMRCIFPAE